MKAKLRQLMESEDLKLSQLAARLEVKAPALSHILSGRNNPGLEMIQRILSKFPHVNPDWLLLDSEQMYRETPQPGDVGRHTPTTKPGSDLFNQETEPYSVAEDPHADSSPERSKGTIDPRLIRESRKGAAVSRVVIFYDDHTFESYDPTRP